MPVDPLEREVLDDVLPRRHHHQVTLLRHAAQRLKRACIKHQEATACLTNCQSFSGRSWCGAGELLGLLRPKGEHSCCPHLTILARISKSSAAAANAVGWICSCCTEPQLMWPCRCRCMRSDGIAAVQLKSRCGVLQRQGTVHPPGIMGMPSLKWSDLKNSCTM